MTAKCDLAEHHGSTEAASSSVSQGVEATSDTTARQGRVFKTFLDSTDYS